MCEPTEESDERVVLEATVGETPSSKILKLCMLGCEDRPPYGPTQHTATMFLNLLQQAAEKDCLNIKIRITIYRVQQQDYPASYSDIDGVLLPGSFSAAYNEDEWIVKLKDVIQNDLWENKVPTLGVCFGHQILAHALDGGKAIKCPASTHAGCRFMDTFGAEAFLADTSSNKSPLLYTHGDMVETLPVMATRFGGTETVPNQAAIYNDESSRPVFVTLQAHPEYASEGPEQPTLKKILHVLEERKAITSDQHVRILQDVNEHWAITYQSSVQSMIATCRLLKWFPGDD